MSGPGERGGGYIDPLPTFSGLSSRFDQVVIEGIKVGAQSELVRDLRTGRGRSGGKVGRDRRSAR